MLELAEIRGLVAGLIHRPGIIDRSEQQVRTVLVIDIEQYRNSTVLTVVPRQILVCLISRPEIRKKLTNFALYKKIFPSRFTRKLLNAYLFMRVATSRNPGDSSMTGRIEKVLIALCVAALAATAMASETINYTYDARGRLVQVKHNGTINNNVSATYTYDKAGNRNNLNVVSPNPPPP